MPRGKRPVQPASVGPSQVYGQGTELTRSMHDIPLPDAKAQLMQTASQGLPPAAAPGQVAAPATGGRATTGGGAAPPGGGTPPAAWQEALASATQMAPPANGGALGQAAAGMLAPTAPYQSAGVQFWSKLAEVTGDPGMIRLAQRARLYR